MTLILQRGGDASKFVFPQQSVIHKNAGEAVAERAAHQRGSNGGINPSGKGAKRQALAHLGSDALHSFVNERAREPIRLDAADIEDETPEDFRAAVGMMDLRMEFQD